MQVNAINILEADITCVHIHNKHLIIFTWEIQAVASALASVLILGLISVSNSRFSSIHFLYKYQPD